MPAVIVFLVGTGAAWFGFRALNRAMQRVASDLSAAETELLRRETAGTRLERDPKTGIYRPQRTENSSR